jgi:hypothetical protein
MPIDPEDLPGHVIAYYGEYMRPGEFQEYKELISEAKRLTDELMSDYGARIEERPGKRLFYLTEDACADPRWQAYCERRVAFYQRTSDRILQDHEVFLNRCPYCNSLARTPTAKQCAKCYKRWG